MVGLKTVSPEDHHQGRQARKITKEARKVNVFPAKLVNTNCLTYYCSIDKTTFVKLLEQGKITGSSSFELHPKAKWLLWSCDTYRNNRKEPGEPLPRCSRYHRKWDLPNVADRHSTSLEISLGMYFPESLGNYMVAGRSPVLVTGAFLPKINFSINT